MVNSDVIPAVISLLNAAVLASPVMSLFNAVGYSCPVVRVKPVTLVYHGDY